MSSQLPAAWFPGGYNTRHSHQEQQLQMSGTHHNWNKEPEKEQQVLFYLSTSSGKQGITTTLIPGWLTGKVSVKTSTKWLSRSQFYYYNYCCLNDFGTFLPNVTDEHLLKVYPCKAMSFKLSPVSPMRVVLLWFKRFKICNI